MGSVVCILFRSENCVPQARGVFSGRLDHCPLRLRHLWQNRCAVGDCMVFVFRVTAVAHTVHMCTHDNVGVWKWESMPTPVTLTVWHCTPYCHLYCLGSSRVRLCATDDLTRLIIIKHVRIIIQNVLVLIPGVVLTHWFRCMMPCLFGVSIFMSNFFLGKLLFAQRGNFRYVVKHNSLFLCRQDPVVDPYPTSV